MPPLPCLTSQHERLQPTPVEPLARGSTGGDVLLSPVPKKDKKPLNSLFSIIA